MAIRSKQKSFHTVGIGVNQTHLVAQKEGCRELPRSGTKWLSLAGEPKKNKCQH